MQLRFGKFALTFVVWWKFFSEFLYKLKYFSEILRKFTCFLRISYIYIYELPEIKSKIFVIFYSIISEKYFNFFRFYKIS